MNVVVKVDVQEFEDDFEYVSNELIEFLKSNGLDFESPKDMILLSAVLFELTAWIVYHYPGIFNETIKMLDEINDPPSNTTTLN